MPPTISFRANQFQSSTTSEIIDHNEGSGIGFFGQGYGYPIALGKFNESTWVTNEDGTGTATIQLNNTRFLTQGTSNVQGTVDVNEGNEINLSNLPNYLATLNIRFVNDAAVVASSPKLVIYDRNSISNHAVDVTTYCYEVRHPNPSQSATALSLRGDADGFKWYAFEKEAGDNPAAPVPMPLTPCPGPSGLNTTDTDTTTGDYNTWLVSEGLTPATYGGGGTKAFTQHDWYVAISCSPQQIGQKTSYALYFTVEYI